MYTPKVKATYDNFQSSDSGNAIFFGGSYFFLQHQSYSLALIPSIPDTLGSERSPPSVLPRVCVGPSTLPEHRGRLNIFWELLPCCLQNGADITNYIILCTPKSTGATTRISSTSGMVECSQEFGDLYLCVVATSLIPNSQAISIQVAAQSDNGEGPFSDPINISTSVSSIKYLMCVASYLNYIWR